MFAQKKRDARRIIEEELEETANSLGMTREELLKGRAESLGMTEEELKERAESWRMTTGHYARVLGLTRSFEYLPEVQQLVVEKLSDLRDLGIEAHSVERQGSTTVAWIELAEVPIRWMYCSFVEELGVGEGFFVLQEEVSYVPDSRIRVDFPRMRIYPSPVKSRRFFGHIMGVRWETGRGLSQESKDFSRRVADSLTNDTAPTQAVLRGWWPFLPVGIDAVRGCWTFRKDNSTPGSDSMTSTKELWDYYQGIAETLLAMPLPTD